MQFRSDLTRVYLSLSRGVLNRVPMLLFVNAINPFYFLCVNMKTGEYYLSLRQIECIVKGVREGNTISCINEMLSAHSA